MRNNSHIIGANTNLSNYTTNERPNINQSISNNNNNKNLSGEAEQENLLLQIDLLSKEKNALESQLVIIKLKYAEVSSDFGELQDEKTSLLSKVEELNQKLILKEEVISHLINEKEKSQMVNYSAAANFSSNNNNNFNNNNYHTYSDNNCNQTMRELNSNNIKNTHSNYDTNVNNNQNENLNFVKFSNSNNKINNSNNNLNTNNGVSFTQRNSTNDYRITKGISDNKNNNNNNIDYSNYENFANEKIIKKIQNNFDENQTSKRTNYNTTVGNDYIESEANTNIGNSVYNKTEHELKMQNYKALQKNQKNKSFGLIGSIKNFFTNDKK